MSRSFRKSVEAMAVATVVTTATVGLAATGAGAAPAARVAATSLPKLGFTISKAGLKLFGPRTFAAGRIAISLTSVGAERKVAVVSFKAGFTFSDLVADLTAFGKSEGAKGPTKAGLKHLDDAIAHTTLLGGLDADKGKTLNGTVVLPAAGTYYAYNDGGEVPTQPQKLMVTAPAGAIAATPSSATVTAVNGYRFGGATTLPASGTITFKNASTQSPHFLSLIEVKTGTTRQQVLKYLLSGSNSNPPFGLPGYAGTDAVSPGHSQTLTYTLPKGEYVELCFFPDPKTGIPHALMGMIGVVKLK